jgi:hypothetical protein
LKKNNPIWNFTPLLLLLIIVLPADWEELFFFSSALLVLVLVQLKQSLGFIIVGWGGIAVEEEAEERGKLLTQHLHYCLA